MARKRPSVQKRQREYQKRQRELDKAKKAAEKRERRQNRGDVDGLPVVEVGADGEMYPVAPATPVAPAAPVADEGAASPVE